MASRLSRSSGMLSFGRGASLSSSSSLTTPSPIGGQSHKGGGTAQEESWGPLPASLANPGPARAQILLS